MSAKLIQFAQMLSKNASINILADAVKVTLSQKEETLLINHLALLEQPKMV